MASAVKRRVSLLWARRRGCLLLAVSSVLAAGLAELGVRALGHRPIRVTADRTVFWSYHPSLGWHHRPSRRGVFEAAGARVQVMHNSRGLRGPEVSYTRRAGRKRILVLGDSFAWGYGVEQHEAFGERVAAALEGVEVINGGVSGYGTDQELIWLRSEGMKYRPDLVLLLLSGNDDEMNRRRVAFLVYPKPYFELTAGGGLELRNVPVPRAAALRRLAYLGCTRSALVNLLVGRSARALRAWRAVGLSRLRETSVAESPALTLALVEEIRQVAAGGGARFMVVATGMFWPRESPVAFADLVGALRGRGFEVLDVEAAAGFAGERMRLPGDGHWNREGHAFAAARTAELIERRGLLDDERPALAPGR